MENFGRVLIIYWKPNQLFGRGNMSLCQRYSVLSCYSAVLESDV